MMLASLPLALAGLNGGSTPEFSEVLTVVLIGFSFVLIVLASLALITSAIGLIMTNQRLKEVLDRTAAQAATTQTLKEAVEPLPEEEKPVEDDPTVLAVVAAAIHSVIGDRPHRIVSIRSGGPGWAQEGRRQIFSSHRVR